MSNILISKSTSQITQVNQLIKTVNANVLTARPDDDAEPDLQLAQDADLAVVDGKAIQDGDKEEQRILTTALEGNLPIIMKNATTEVMTSFAGVGTDADTVLLQSQGKGTQVEIVDTGELASRLSGIQAPPTPGATAESPTVMGADMTDFDEEAEMASALAAPLSMLAQSEPVGMPPTPFSTERPDLPEGTYHAFYMQQTIHETKWIVPGAEDDGKVGPALKNPGSNINIGYFVELYATDYPRQKYVVITTAGTGFSLGVAESLSLRDRGWYLEYAYNVIGPRHSSDGHLEKMAPEAENTSTNVSNSTGFGVGVEANLGFEGKSLTGSLGVSANWEWSRSVSIDLPDFEVRSYSFLNKARWAYLLNTVGDGIHYNDWRSLIDDDDLRSPPVISYTSVPIHHQAVWRFAPHDERTIPFDVSVKGKVRRVSGANGNWTSQWRSSSLNTPFSIDLSEVTHERAPIFPKPQFLSKIQGKDGNEDLVFYRPGTDSIFYLKSSGDGEFEVIHTEVDFDNLKTKTTHPTPKKNYLAKHTVRPGESLSLIAYKYYKSGVRDMWMRIYNENKRLIGRNPIRPGMVLTIPFKEGPLPSEALG